MKHTSGVILLMNVAVILCAMPPIHKCKLSDTACLKSSSQAAVPYLIDGIPELGTEVLDVMHIPFTKVELAGLKMDVKDAEIKGLRDLVIQSISVDINKKILQFTYNADIVFKGQYKADGRLLVLPITGDGILTIKLKNLQVDLTIPFNIKKNEDGKDCIDPKSYTYKYNVKDKANFHATNLFNGNKALSDPMLKFMNENWKVLTEEFGRPILDQPMKKVFQAIKAYLRSQPLDDIVDN